MKHIKLFEEKTYFEKTYWSIKKDRYILKIALEKLGVPTKSITLFVDQFDFYVGDNIYISYNPFEEDGDYKWYSSSLDLVKYNYYKYMGEVKLTKKELEKIDLKRKLDKYNI